MMIYDRSIRGSTCEMCDRKIIENIKNRRFVEEIREYRKITLGENLSGCEGHLLIVRMHEGKEKRGKRVNRRYRTEG